MANTGSSPDDPIIVCDATVDVGPPPESEDVVHFDADEYETGESAKAAWELAEERLSDFDCHGTIVFDDFISLSGVLPSCGIHAPFCFDNRVITDTDLKDKIVILELDEWTPVLSGPAPPYVPPPSRDASESAQSLNDEGNDAASDATTKCPTEAPTHTSRRIRLRGASRTVTAASASSSPRFLIDPKAMNTIRRIAAREPVAIIIGGLVTNSIYEDAMSGSLDLEHVKALRLPVIVNCDTALFDWLKGGPSQPTPGSAEQSTAPSAPPAAIEQALIPAVPLKPGDHIYREIRSSGIEKLATHHGIYVGNGRVIHFSGNDLTAKGLLGSRGVSAAKIRCTSIATFMKYGCTLKKRRTAPDYDRQAAVLRAEEAFALQNFGDYDLVKRNCESFATYCQTGKAESAQVQKAALFGGVAAAAAIGIPAVTIGILVASALTNKRRRERDQNR